MTRCNNPGPPGVGKTELALAVVRELQTNVVLVTSSEIRSKVVGQAEVSEHIHPHTGV